MVQKDGKFKVKFILISLVITSNIFAHILFKIASNEIINLTLMNLISNWKILLGGFLQIIALLFWIKLLQSVELYWAALMVTLIPLGLVFVSIFIFNESLSLMKIIGALLIISGVFIINY